MDGQHDWNFRPPSGFHSSFRPDTPLMQFYMAAADPMLSVNYSGRVTPDMVSTMRRSRTRSIGNTNSPTQLAWSMPWMGSPGYVATSPFNPFRSLSAGPNMLPPQSPLLLNGFRPPSAAPNAGSRSPVAFRHGPSPPLSEHRMLEAPPAQSIRAPKFKSSEWDSHKDNIKQLFLDEDKSLDDTMRIMEERFSFTPSKKQYNNKLRQWGFIKKIPGSTANWMANKARSRKREGKETEFTVGDQPWTIDRIERSARRAKLDLDEAAQADMTTPPGVSYGTPGKEPKDPQLVRDNLGISATAPRIASWNPYLPAAPQTCFRLQWDGKRKADIDGVYQRSKQLVQAGNLHDAEKGYLQTLGGYEALLGPTDRDTNTVAYELADLYAKINRMDEADKVLDWMSEKHMERWGLRHKNIREHMIQVADFLESWSRIDDAVALTKRMADSYEMSSSFPSVALGNTRIGQFSHQHQEVDYMRDEYRLPPIGKRAFALNSDDGDTVQMDYQVRLAMMRAKAEDEEALPLLLRLLERCERHPAKLAVQILEGRISLLELYDALGLQDKFQESLLDIPKTSKIIFESETERTELLLLRAIDMIQWLVERGNYEQAHPLFRQIEAEAVEWFNEESEVTISVSIRIGTILQDHDRWEDARPRFEQALASSMSANISLESPLIKSLEDALYEKKYTKGVATPEDIRRQAILTTKKSLGTRVLRRQYRPCLQITGEQGESD